MDLIDNSTSDFLILDSNREISDSLTNQINSFFINYGNNYNNIEIPLLNFDLSKTLPQELLSQLNRTSLEYNHYIKSLDLSSNQFNRQFTNDKIHSFNSDYDLTQDSDFNNFLKEKYKEFQIPEEIHSETKSLYFNNSNVSKKDSVEHLSNFIKNISESQTKNISDSKTKNISESQTNKNSTYIKNNIIENYNLTLNISENMNHSIIMNKNSTIKKLKKSKKIKKYRHKNITSSHIRKEKKIKIQNHSNKFNNSKTIKANSFYENENKNQVEKNKNNSNIILKGENSSEELAPENSKIKLNSGSIENSVHYHKYKEDLKKIDKLKPVDYLNETNENTLFNKIKLSKKKKLKHTKKLNNNDLKLKDFSNKSDLSLQSNQHLKEIKEIHSQSN